jgi:hypothetical protein
LVDALQIPQGIQETHAGKPINKILLAEAIKRTPSSSEYFRLLSTSYQYGLTLGTEKAEQISLTSTGVSITKPTSEAERLAAVRSAALTPPLFRTVYNHYKNGKLPSADLFKNVLERNFGVPADSAELFIDLLIKNGLTANLLKQVNGDYWVVFEEIPQHSEPTAITTSPETDQTEISHSEIVEPVKKVQVIEGERRTDAHVFNIRGIILNIPKGPKIDEAIISGDLAPVRKALVDFAKNAGLTDEISNEEGNK